MNTLARNNFISLIQFQSELYGIPSSQIDERLDFMLKRVCHLTRSSRCMMTLMLREPSALISKVQRINTQIGQWRPYLHEFYNYKASDLLMLEERARDREVGEDSVLSELCDRLHGLDRHMTYRASKDVELFQAMDARYPNVPYLDRLMGVHVYDPQIELYLMVDRVEGEEVYTEEEEEVLAFVVQMLSPLMYHLCVSHGLLVDEGMEALTPRERETLLLLLGARTEKEMAQVMGLTHRSMHQYVLRVYTKLNVSSRAELSSLWLEIPSLSA